MECGSHLRFQPVEEHRRDCFDPKFTCALSFPFAAPAELALRRYWRPFTKFGAKYSIANVARRRRRPLLGEFEPSDCPIAWRRGMAGYFVSKHHDHTYCQAKHCCSRDLRECKIFQVQQNET